MDRRIELLCECLGHIVHQIKKEDIQTCPLDNYPRRSLTCIYIGEPDVTVCNAPGLSTYEFLCSQKYDMDDERTAKAKKLSKYFRSKFGIVPALEHDPELNLIEKVISTYKERIVELYKEES